MRMEGKTEAVLEWAKTWPEIDGFLKLNAIKNQDGDASMATVFSDSAGEPFIDGSARREFTFGLRLMLDWSDGFDPTNAEAEELVVKWRDWVDDQFPNNIPYWDCQIEKIEALYDVPAITVYQEESLAEYSFQARITYIE